MSQRHPLTQPPASSNRRAAAFCLSLSLMAINFGCAAARQQEFDTPELAVEGLVQALRADDTASLSRIFGPDSDDLIDSGDAVADRKQAEKFLAAFDQRHQLTPNAEGGLDLEIGPDAWPLPIPLVKDASSGKWRFDTDAGFEEVINRRIGRNELDVIEVCRAIADAQMEFARRDPDGDGVPEYATRLVSEDGKKNGLYWPTTADEQPSPLGPLVADAVAEGYGGTRTPGEPRPYHGYYYRLLRKQGQHAPGGAMDYVVNGRMIGGFAVIAHPADYGNSGIMTFIVDRQGVVYQKDLGEDTIKLAKAIDAFDPDPSWKVVPPTTGEATTTGDASPQTAN